MAGAIALGADAEVVDSFDELGVMAFTTGRAAGSFGVGSSEPVVEVMGRWNALRQLVGGREARLATATQVHGAQILEHAGDWRGWLRGPDADGHLAFDGSTAMAVSVADCVPVFLTHPGGAMGVLHSGWRGTAARITDRAIDAIRSRGLPVSDLRMHCGPAICGRCYEVSAEVHAELTGRDPGHPTLIDLRSLIADRAHGQGVRHISISELCTRCDNDRFFSHRAGDAGRQLGVIARRP